MVTGSHYALEPELLAQAGFGSENPVLVALVAAVLVIVMLTIVVGRSNKR